VEREDARAAVEATLAVVEAVAARTRSQADDLLVAMLRANRDRLAEAVLALLEDSARPPTAERVAAALATVGITV
jgi:hypothetical protein